MWIQRDSEFSTPRGERTLSGRNATAQVVVNENTPEEDVEALQRHLETHGIAGSIEASYPVDAEESFSVGLTHHDPGVSGRYGSNQVAWTAFVHARVNELARACPPDALRNFADGLRALRAKQTDTSPAGGLLFLVDEDTGVRFDLDYQLPLQAYADLEGLRVSTLRSDPVFFDRRSGPNGRWRAPR